MYPDIFFLCFFAGFLLLYGESGKFSLAAVACDVVHLILRYTTVRRTAAIEGTVACCCKLVHLFCVSNVGIKEDNELLRRETELFRRRLPRVSTHQALLSLRIVNK